MALPVALAACSDGRLEAFVASEAPAERGGMGGGGFSGSVSGGAGSPGGAGSGIGGTAGGAGAGSGGESATSGGGQAGSEPGIGLLLDDFEDQDIRAALPEDAWWYGSRSATDAPSVALSFEPVSGRGISRFGARLQGGPFQGFDAFLGLDLPGPAFDATRFAELSFFARVDPPMVLSVQFLAPTEVHYAVDVSATADWQEIRVPLADFVSLLPDASPLDPREVTHFQVWVRNPTNGFDLWVDDVWLLYPP